MPEKHLFEYAIIRLVPRVEREEFLNVGVILYCSGQAFLEAKFVLNKEKIHLFDNASDVKEIEEHLFAICRICKGEDEGGPIGKLTLPERFRWLTATRSTIVQTSKVHPGFCTDAEETLERLFEQMVR